MKIQYSYLKSFLPTDLSQIKLADVFTKVGFECELDGAMIDFDITPNRGDVLSLRGLQREFHAHQSKKLKDHLAYSKLSFKKDKMVIDKINHEACGNYNLMSIRGVSSIRSLDTKKQRFLLAAGVPLISPLVDLGNYVMLEMGTPMHIFDLDRLALPINVLFPAIRNSSLQVIGGEQKNIDISSLTIQDQEGIQALAGIIGGDKTSVSKQTKNIAVEAAFFYPEKIMNQARKYGLATDASHRFERGVDPELQKQALARFLFLLSDVAKYDSMECFEGSSKLFKTQYIFLSAAKFNSFSGLALSDKQIQNILKNLGFDCELSGNKKMRFKVPSHRFDIGLEEDLYEEILRCYGYDNVPITPPKPGPSIAKKEISIASELKSGLVFSGFKELMHIPFVSEETFSKLNGNSWAPAELLNPINANEPFMRGSLFGALFSAVHLNLKKGHSAIKVFELGNVFHKAASGFNQEKHLAGIIYHHELQSSWSSQASQYNFYSVKAEILKLLDTLGIHGLSLSANSSDTVFNVNSMDIFVGKKKIGAFGEIDIAVTQKLIKNPAFGFELYPDNMSNKPKNIKLIPTSKFPLSTRDMNILISKSIEYAEIDRILAKGKIKFLNAFSLTNTFEGKGIPNGFISMTFRFTFQSNNKSLTESEINDSMDHAFNLLSKAVKAEIRT